MRWGDGYKGALEEGNCGIYIIKIHCINVWGFQKEKYHLKRSLPSVTAQTWAEQGHHQWTCQMDWGRTRGLNPTQRTTGHWGQLGAGQEVFSREEHTNWCPVPNSPQNIYTSNILWPNRLYLGIYMYIYTCMYVHAIAIIEKENKKKKGPWIEGNLGGTYKEGLEGGKGMDKCNYITISDIIRDWKTNPHVRQDNSF